MNANQAELPVTRLCEVLGLSAGGYHAWLNRAPSQRALAHERLTRRIGEIHEATRGTYGVPRVHAELRAEGIRVSRKRVARLMRQRGVQGAPRRKGFKATRRRRGRHGFPDVVERKFRAEAPERPWGADITYIPAKGGFVFLAVVLDAPADA